MPLSAPMIRPLALLTALAIIAGCRTKQVDSVWRSETVVIDGELSDWPGGLTPLQPAPLAVGLTNDADHLYLALSVNDPGLSRRIMMGGFTVWLDPQGGRKQRVGIRFPIGPWQGASARRQWDPADEPGRFWERTVLARDQVEIVGPGKSETRLFPASGDGHVAVMITADRDGLSYELKIPLKAGPNWPLDLQPADSQRLGIGLETTDFARGSRAGSRRSGGMRPPGRGSPGLGGRGGSGGRLGRGGRRPGGHRPEPLDLWLRVTLAQPPG